MPTNALTVLQVLEPFGFQMAFNLSDSDKPRRNNCSDMCSLNGKCIVDIDPTLKYIRYPRFHPTTTTVESPAATSKLTRDQSFSSFLP